MKQGFTLIELMVVVSVIAILSMIALFGIGQARGAARDTQRLQIMNGIRGALERSYGVNGTYYNTADFQAMLTQLTTNRFIGQVTDPGCGSSPIDFSAGSGVWRPCGAGTDPVYYYEAPDGTHCTGNLGSEFQLRLVKEKGGVNYYCSPK